jgi:hypothetical protein
MKPLFSLLRRASWSWYTPDKNTTCGAWPRWTVAIDIPPWGLGVRGEYWGLRFILIRLHLCCMYPEKKTAK